MAQNRASPIVQRIGFAALLAIILAGRGAGKVATPPPPPPFRLKTINMNLGEHKDIDVLGDNPGGRTHPDRVDPDSR